MEETQTSESIRLILEPDVSFVSREVGPRTVTVAHQKATGKFFQLGPEEHEIATMLDGSRSMPEILEVIQQRGLQWSAEEVAELLSRFVSSGIATPVASDNNHPANSKPKVGWPVRVTQALAFVISQRIPLLSGNVLATRIERRIGFFFSTSAMGCWFALVATGLMIVSANTGEFAKELRRIFDPGMWVILFFIWVIAKIVHELGHATAARHHGVHVGKIGIMFFLFAPLAFVDVTDAWKLRSRWSRIQIALAGVYFELAIAAVAAWCWWFLPAGMPRHLAAQIFLVAGPATLLVNANPLLRLDGYYVVADLTEISNLRMHGRRQLGSWLEQKLVSIPAPAPLLHGWRRGFATVHAFASVVFQFVWMGGLVIGVAMWAKGVGVILALAALLLWALIPLCRWIFRVWTYDHSGRWFNLHRRRLVGLASLLLLCFPYFSLSSSPLARRVPVVIEYRDQQIARAATEAFVDRVYVTPGQRVEAGMVLMELRNPELRMRRDQKSDELALAELRAIQFRRTGELSRSASETETAESLVRQLRELDDQIGSLKVIATRDGLVIGPRIDTLEGRFVKPGDLLITVSDPQEKELLVSIGESDVEAFRYAIENKIQAQVRLRGGATFEAMPAPFRPRARQTLPHPALSASAGGPLPVEPSPNPDEDVRVIEPQMESVTKLDAVTSAQVRVGQIGTMTIDDNQSIVQRLTGQLWR